MQERISIVFVHFVIISAPENAGWCAAAGDNQPWIEVKLDKPRAVSIFQFQFPARSEQHPDKQFVRQWDLQYISPLDSTQSFRTYASVSALQHANTHYG